jgi:hypothetical protein
MKRTTLPYYLFVGFTRVSKRPFATLDAAVTEAHTRQERQVEAGQPVEVYTVVHRGRPVETLDLAPSETGEAVAPELRRGHLRLVSE